MGRIVFFPPTYPLHYFGGFQLFIFIFFSVVKELGVALTWWGLSIVALRSNGCTREGVSRLVARFYYSNQRLIVLILTNVL